MDLRQHVGRFVGETLKLGQLEDVVGLAAALFSRVVDEDGVCLVPALALGGGRVGGGNGWVVPDAGEALVALDAGGVVGGGEAELVAAPDDEALCALLGGEQLGDHLVDVFGAGRGPDGDVEGVDAVVEELAGVGPLDEVEGVALVGAVEQRAVEVHDDEDAAGVAEGRRQREGLGDVEGRGVGDAAGCFAGGDAPVLREVLGGESGPCWRGSGDEVVGVVEVVGREVHEVGVVEVEIVEVVGSKRWIDLLILWYVEEGRVCLIVPVLARDRSSSRSRSRMLRHVVQGSLCLCLCQRSPRLCLFILL